MPSVTRTVGRGQNVISKSSAAGTSKKRDRLRAERRAICILAAGGAVSAFWPGVGHAQSLAIPTPLLDITANDYNPVSGILTPNVGQSGLIITGQGGPALTANSTANGASALTLNGSNWLQFNNSGGGRDVLGTGNNDTIVAYIEPGSVPSSTAYTILGGAVGAVQYRLDGGNNEQSVLRAQQAHFGDSNTSVSTSSYSAVGTIMPTGTTGTASFFLNGNADGSENISSGTAGGFDQVGGRDNGNGSQETYTGNIVEVELFNTVLTPAQIEQVQNQMAMNYTSTTQLYYKNGTGNFGNGSTSFTTITGSSATYADNTNSVVFGDTVAGGQTPITNPNIVIAAGGVSPTAVTFNNNYLNYSLTDSDGTNGITGSTGITKNYNGTLTFNASNQFTGPVVLGGGNTVLNANGAIDTASSILVGSGAVLTVNPGITFAAPAGVNLSGGTLNVSSGASVTTTGGIMMSGGTLGLTSGSIIAPNVPIVLNSTSNIYVPTNATLTNTISGAGGLTVNQPGLLTLAGSNTYSGTTTVSNGGLQITGTYNPAGTANLAFGAGGATNTLIINGGNATFNGLGRIDLGTNAGTVGNIVVNSGSLNIAGAVSIGDDNYGEMTVNGGTATLTGLLGLSYPNGVGSAVNVLGGTLITTSPLAGITVGNRGHAAQVNLDGGTLIASTVQGNNNGVLNFNGGTLQANASTPVLVQGLSSAFIYPAGGTINDGGMNVTVPQSFSSPTGAGLTAVALTTPGTGYSYIPTVQVTGGTVTAGGVGASAVAVYNAATGQVTGVRITNPGNYASTTGVAFTFSGGGGTAPSVTYSSANNSGGGLTKTGSGTLTLTGNSTYSGPTIVQQGTLQVSAPGPSVAVPNGSFATPVVPSYEFGNGTTTVYGANASWTFSSGNTGITNGAGYGEDGTPPAGSQYAFLQKTGTISQTLSFPTTANYILNYYTEQRNGGNSATQSFDVQINGSSIAGGSVTPGVTWAAQSYIFPATAGSNTLSFVGLNPNSGVGNGDNSALLNDISINEIGGSTTSSAVPSISQVNVMAGATFDVNSYITTVGSLAGPGNVTLGSGTLSVGGDNTTNGNFTGGISGTGSLNKVGTGTQLLSGTNTYTGPTTITQGNLALGAGTVLVSPSIAVANGGILGAKPGAGGTSTYGGMVTVAPGGSISLVDGNIGKLSLTNAAGLTLGSSGSTVPANLTFEISNNAVDMINVAGVVSALSPVSITIEGIASDTSLTPGNYTIVTAAGGLGTSSYSLGGINAIAVNGEGYGLSLSHSTSTSEVVTITDIGSALATAYWKGTQDANWGTNNGGATNFATDSTGATDTGALPSAFTNVYFTVGSGGMNLATQLSSNQSINSITFNGYAAAPVSISGYTLSIGAAAIGSNAAGNGLNMASGSTAVTINSNVMLVNSQTWTNNSTNPLTVNGSIGGISSLTQAGPGLVILAGNNTFNGGYNLSAGTLDINSNGALGTGNFAINTATTLDNTSGAPVNLAANNTQTWNSDFTFAGTNNLNMGNGAITISANRTVNISTGSLTVGGISDGGQVYALITTGNGNLSLSGSSSYTGYTAIHGGSSLSFVGAGGLSGGGTLFLTPGSATSTVTANFNSTGSETFSNIALGNSVGTAVFNLSSGIVNVNGGTLTATGGATSIVNVTGGTWNAGSATVTGQGGNFEFGNGGLAILNQSGGNINVTGGEPLDVLLSTFATGATFNLTGGNFQTTGGMVVGYRYPAFVNVSGTAHLTSPQIVLGAVGTSGGYNGTGSVNISTGGIITTSLFRESGNGGFVNFNGGTLQASSSTTTLLSGFSTGTINALAGGAIIDTNGYNVTVASPIVSPAGVTGGITKVGAGTLILTANNGYSGTTTVSAGTLQLPLLNNGAVANPSFETPTVPAQGYVYAPAGATWSFSNDGGAAPEGAGITNGGGFTFNGTPPDGSQAAFVQEDGYFSQNINFPTDATYTLSFYTEQRATGNGMGQAIDAILDNPNAGGLDLGSGGFTPGNTWAQTTYIFSTTAGSHQLTFEGLDPNGDDSTAYVDEVSITGGGLSGTSTVIPAASPVVIAANATFDTNNNSQQIGSLTGPAMSSVIVEAGTLTMGNDNTSTNFAGVISGAGSIAKVGTGVQTLSGSNTYTGGTNVSSGTLAFASPTAFPAFTSLNVIGGTAMAAIHNSSSPKNTLFVSGLSISGATGAWTGTVDLTNNEMVVRNGSFATVLNQIVQGYAGGSWQGSGGILSSAAAADPRHLTTLAVVQNSMDGTTTGNPIFTTFDGQTVTDSDVLVKYTYYGDANLDGTVDGTDYSRIDNGYLMGLTGWYNGDFNYDGVIDGSDYTLIDNAYNQQGASLAASVATPTAQIENSSVPEPATSSLLALGAVGLLSRRRTGRHRN